VNWASHAYLMYKKQWHLESSRKRWQENLVWLGSLHTQQSLLLVASSFKLLNNFLITSFSRDVLPSNIPNFNSSATTPSKISNLVHLLRPPSSLARNLQHTTQAMNWRWKVLRQRELLQKLHLYKPHYSQLSLKMWLKVCMTYCLQSNKFF
jgi:hypothetical protein